MAGSNHLVITTIRLRAYDIIVINSDRITTRLNKTNEKVEDKIAVSRRRVRKGGEKSQSQGEIKK